MLKFYAVALVAFVVISVSLHQSVAKKSQSLLETPVLAQQRVSQEVLPVEIKFYNSQVAIERHPASVEVKINAQDLAPFLDSARNFSQRVEQIALLGKKRDARSMALLMALGNEKSLLSPVAIKSLAFGKGPDVEDYLKSKVNHSDPAIALAAISSYTKVAGENAIPTLTALLQNSSRIDGYDNSIRMEAVAGLSIIGTSDVYATLITELSNANRNNWSYEIGSVIVKTLLKSDDPRSQAALRQYIAILTSKNITDPTVKRYVESKIREAQGLEAENG